jgi:hypothetical protein
MHLRPIAMATIIVACSKEVKTPLREVLILITNKVRVKLLIYNTADLHPKLMDIYYCSYKSILPIYLGIGNYKIVAENFRGKE